jgi:benzoyl-CoA 2,3-dioxygenase component B
MIERGGHAFRLTLPSSHFRRSIGPWAGVPTDTHGGMIAREEYERRLEDWIPSERDKAFVHSLMQKVIEPGKMAAWIAPPERGINNLALDYEYVHLH